MDRCQSSSCPTSNPLHGLQLPHVVNHLSADELPPPPSLGILSLRERSELSVRILRLFQQQHTGMVYGCQLFGITDVDTDIHRTTSQTDGQTQTPEAARLLSQLRRLVLLKLRSHYNISHQRWISWPVSVNQCDKCKYVYYTTALLSFFWLPAAQSGW